MTAQYIHLLIPSSFRTVLPLEQVAIRPEIAAQSGYNKVRWL